MNAVRRAISRVGSRLGTAMIAVGRSLGGPSPGRRFMGMDAGKIKQNDPDFIPPLEGPDTQATRYLSLARRRTRWLVENHPLLAGARETYIRNVAGVEPYPEPATGDRTLDKQIRALMWTMYRHGDVSREKSVADIFADGLREYFAVGELFAHRFTAPAFRRLPAGPCIEIVDTDRLPLDSGHFRPGRVADQNAVRLGVEFDRFKRRVGYLVLEEHPADLGSMTAAYQTRRIDAERATLGFNSLRANQARGIPHCAPITSSSREEDTYREASVVAARAAAMVAYFYKGAKPPKADGASTVPTDADGNPLLDFFPGVVGFLPPGVEFAETNPNRPGPQFVAVMELLSRRMAAGVGMSYTAFTRDSSKATFAAQRADSLEDRRGYRIAQRRTASWVILPWYRDVVDFGVATGKIDLSSEQLARFLEDPSWLYEHTLVFSGWEWVNPAQEASAAAVELELGITSRKRLAANNGAHWEDLIVEECEVEKFEAEERARLGLPPRQRATSTPQADPVAEPDTDPSQPQDQPQDQDQEQDQPDDRGAPGTPPGGLVRGARLRAHLDRLARIAADEAVHDARRAGSLNGVHP